MSISLQGALTEALQLPGFAHVEHHVVVSGDETFSDMQRSEVFTSVCMVLAFVDTYVEQWEPYFTFRTGWPDGSLLQASVIQGDGSRLILLRREC